MSVVCRCSLRSLPRWTAFRPLLYKTYQTVYNVGGPRQCTAGVRRVYRGLRTVYGRCTASGVLCLSYSFGVRRLVSGWHYWAIGRSPKGITANYAQ